MSDSGMIKSVAYHPGVIRIVRLLGLRKIARRVYFALRRPKGGLLSVRRGSIEATFLVQTPEELRVLESLGGGEADVLDDILSRTQAGACVFDVGANVGLYSVLLAIRVGSTGRVVAFEPDPQNFDHLRANIAANRLSNVECVRLALGAATATAKLVQGDIIGNYALSRADDEKRGNTVSIVCGDEFRDERQLPVPSVVKIDVEGFEHDVITGLRRALSDPRCQCVCVEVHPYLLPPGITSDDVLTLLSSCGFKHRTIRNRPKDFHVIMWK